MKVLIATPALGCTFQSTYVSSLVNLIEYCTKSYIGFDFLALGHESILSRARNNILHHALTAGNWTHLLMIDSDMGWEWNALELLKEADRPVISALCPKKKYPIEYACELIDGEEIDHKGVLRVKHASTAFMLIKLEAIKDVACYQHNDISIAGKFEQIKDFFPVGVNAKGTFQGEDYGFTQKLTASGIPIFTHTRVKTTHAGQHIFREETK